MSLSAEVELIIGVGTYLDTHAAAVCDARGREVAVLRVPASPAGYEQLLAIGWNFMRPALGRPRWVFVGQLVRFATTHCPRPCAEPALAAGHDHHDHHDQTLDYLPLALVLILIGFVKSIHSKQASQGEVAARGLRTRKRRTVMASHRLVSSGSRVILARPGAE